MPFLHSVGRSWWFGLRCCSTLWSVDSRHGTSHRAHGGARCSAISRLRAELPHARRVVRIHVRVWASRVACCWVAALNNTQPCGIAGETFVWQPGPSRLWEPDMHVLSWALLCCSCCWPQGVAVVWYVCVSLCGHCESACTRGYAKLIGSFSGVYGASGCVGVCRCTCVCACSSQSLAPQLFDTCP